MKLLQQIACGHWPTPRGNTRRMRYEEMVDRAREVCDSLGLGYSLLEVHGEINGRQDIRPKKERRKQAPKRKMLLVRNTDDASSAWRASQRHAISAYDANAGSSLRQRRSTAAHISEEKRAPICGSMPIVQSQTRPGPRTKVGP
jgi:hypothetical protein